MLNINFGLELCISPPHPSCSSLDVFMFSSPSIQPLIPSGLVLGVPKTIAKAEPCRRQRPSTRCCSQLLPGGGGEEGAGPPFFLPPKLCTFSRLCPEAARLRPAEPLAGFQISALSPCQVHKHRGGGGKGIFCFALFCFDIAKGFPVINRLLRKTAS